MPASLFIKTKINDPDRYAKYVEAVRELRAGAGEVHGVLAEQLPSSR